MTSIGDGRAVLFGGNVGPGGTRKSNDAWVLETANAGGALRWVKLVTSGVPPSPRAHHCATAVDVPMRKASAGVSAATPSLTALVVYGGRGSGSELGDLGVLDLEGLTWHTPRVCGTPPQPRAWHAAATLVRPQRLASLCVCRPVLTLTVDVAC